MHDAEKRCTKCGRSKELSAFPKDRSQSDGLHYRCKACMRIQVAMYRQTATHRETLTRYRARPEVRERIRNWNRKNREAILERDREYRQRPRTRILICRRSARYKLKRTTDPARRRDLKALIAQYDAEIKRMDKQAT